MNIYQVREQLRTQSIFELPLRVGYYARVSTEKDEQKNSIEHQSQYYLNMISSNKNWTFAGEYIDSGITGMHSEKRESFNRMLSDAKNGKLDLILTKEISRFARNTLDSIKFTRELLSYGTCVWFQNDGINTIDEDSELRLTIMSGIAQDELRKLSSRVKFGHAQAIKSGTVFGNSLIYGWNKCNGKLVINPEEAKMIRIIFEKYATGQWSTVKLERYLYDLGYRNHKGGKIDRNVIRHIIPNPKYKGYYVGGKVKVVDMFTKKQEFLPEDQWTMYKDETGDIIPAIVDEDIWDKANYYFSQRGNAIKCRRTSFKSNNLFKHKIVCANDGAYYWMKQRGTNHGNSAHNPFWVCSKKNIDGAKSCSSNNLRENKLCELIIKLLQDASGNMDYISGLYMKMYKTATKKKGKHLGQEKEAIQFQITMLKAKLEKILEYNLNGLISDEEFLKRNKEYNEQIKTLEDKYLKLDANMIEDDKIAKESLNKIAESIKKYSTINPDDLTPEIIDSLFEKIVAKTIDSNTTELSFICKSGENFTESYNKKKIPSVVHDVEHILQTDYNLLLNISTTTVEEERYYIRDSLGIVDFAYNGKLIISL